MSLTEQKKAEWEKTLREAALIGPMDTIQEHTKGDFWDMASQISGNYPGPVEIFSLRQKNLCS